MSRVVISKEKYEVIDGFRLPIIQCPGCDENLLGNSSHGVDINGNVNASVVCPHCEFHNYVVLEDWNSGVINKL